VTDTGMRVTPRRALLERVPKKAVREPAATPWAACLALAGVILPIEMQVSIGGANFSPGRIGVILLLFPALFIMGKKGRHALLGDLFAWATAGWIVIAAVDTEGLSALPSAAGGEALEFLGGYLIARAYFFGPTALNMFIRVLRVLAIIAIILAVADSISGRLIVHETIAAIVHAPQWPEAGYRNNMVRAASTFDHAILFGIFCALTAAILLYWEKSLLRRSLCVGLCLLGCVLSFSSAGWMAFLMVLTAYTYDRLMSQYSWRWVVFWIVVCALTFVLLMVSNYPLGWVISHLTLDPQTGYFRLMIWDAALFHIAQAPITGHAYHDFVYNNILDKTVDSVWLVNSLRYGIPMTIFLILTNVAAFLPTKRSFEIGTSDPYMDQIRRAFTIVVLMFMFTGLTVHFLNFMWIFWGLCIGIRASLRELSIEMTRRVPNPMPALGVAHHSLRGC
jgi:hypothetical protein